MPSEKMLQLKSFLDYLEYYGLIRRCGETEQYGNPVFVVQRKNVNSPCRLIIDCRECNKSIAGSVSATMSNVFDEVVNLSKDLVSISQLDLRQAYYSIGLTDETIESGIANLLTPFGAYKCLRALTGWSRVPSFLGCFLREIIETNSNGEFSPLDPQPCQWYDDCNLPRKLGESMDHHIKNLRTIIERVGRAGFKINLSKSVFCIDTVNKDADVLGFKVGFNRVSPNPDKVAAITQLQRPKTVKSLQSFLGSVNFFRQLMPLRAQHGLAILNKKIIGAKLYWDEEADTIFEDIKNSLEGLVIAKNTINSVNLLFRDSSKYAIGSIMFNVPYEKLDITVPDLVMDFVEPNDNTLIQSLEKIGVDLKVYSEGEELLSVLFKAATSLKVVDFKSINQFKRTVFTRITLKARELAPTFTVDNNDQPNVLRSFQNLLYNPNLPMPKYAEHYILNAVSDMTGRKILILNDFLQKKP